MFWIYGAIRLRSNYLEHSLAKAQRLQKSRPFVNQLLGACLVNTHRPFVSASQGVKLKPQQRSHQHSKL